MTGHEGICQVRQINEEKVAVVKGSMLDDGVFSSLSETFKAFGDRNRQKILHLLRDGEKCVSDLLPHFDILQPTVSTHLLLLEEAGLLKVRRDGRRRFYSISNHRIYDALDSFYLEVMELAKT